MLRLDSTKDGFSLAFGSRIILAHSATVPMVFVSTTPPLRWIETGRRAGLWARRNFARELPLRGFSVLEDGPECVRIDFEGRVGIEARVEGPSYRMGIAALEPGLAIRLAFTLPLGTELMGGGADGSAASVLCSPRIQAWNASSPHGIRLPFMPLPLKGRAWPIMSFFSSGNDWFHIDCEGWAEVDCRAKGRLALSLAHAPASIRIGSGESSGQALRSLSEISGRAVLPPAWTREGLILATRSGLPELERQLGQLEGAGIRLAGVRLQDLDIMESPRAHDERVALITSRGLKALARASASLRRGGAAAEAARDAGLVFGTQGWNSDVVWLDPFSEAARAWLRGRLAEGIDSLGLSGLEIDGTPPPFLVTGTELAADSIPGLWTAAWVRDAMDACRASKRGATGEFLASSVIGSGAFQGMPAASIPALVADPRDLSLRVAALLAHGYSGGGVAWLDPSRGFVDRLSTRFLRSRRYSPVARNARYRALELAAFGPVFESSFDGIAATRQQDLRFLARMDAIFIELGSWHEEVAREYREALIPLIRHPAFDHGGAVSQYGANQFAYGRDLLVAAARGTKELVELVLPEGEWVHLWSSRRFEGGEVSVEAPPGHPAVFSRLDSAWSPLFDGIRRNSRRL
ncbi:MAG: hypothetical protein ACOYM2_13985 [Rectinemataceae bacterium]